MKIFLDLSKVILLFMLLIFMLTVKTIKISLTWISNFMNKLMAFGGEKGLEEEIFKIKKLIKDIIKKNYTKIIS